MKTGVPKRITTRHFTLRQIAKVCHEANKVYCASIGDKSQVPWKDAPQWQKDSAINGVKLHLNSPTSTPEDSHNAWMTEKLAGGWVHGEKKSEKKKKHPCLVPYKDLPAEQKVKDYLFVAIAKSFA